MSSSRSTSSFRTSSRGQNYRALVLARTTDLKTTVRLAHLDELQTFITLANINPVIGHSVRILTIILPLGGAYPAQVIRDCLRLTPNVDTLSLILPFSSPTAVLHGVVVPRLRAFETNLPHRALPLFLSLHRSITGIAVEACGTRAECPLRDLNLIRVSDFRGPARCLEGIACGQVEIATVNLTRMTSMAALALQSLASSPLYSLVVDFRPDEYDILTRIASVAPALRKLKLVEKPRNQRRVEDTRRPWNDLDEWHDTLLRIPFLEEFMLHTAVNVSGPQRPEKLVVAGWAYGTRQNDTRHPNLYHISILQRASTPNAQLQALSHWFRRSGSWKRVSATVVDATP